jgi:hypothetical protein
MRGFSGDGTHQIVTYKEATIPSMVGYNNMIRHPKGNPSDEANKEQVSRASGLLPAASVPQLPGPFKL